MLRCGKIDWKDLLRAAAYHLMQLYQVSEVHLVIDDTDRPRSKIIKKLHGVFKTFDKKTGGFFQAQNIVFVLLVTKVFSFPIAFAFYTPDPIHSAWLKEIKKLKKKKVSREEWPKESIRDHKKYPTRLEIAAILLRQVQEFFSNIMISISGKLVKIKVVTVTADAAYFSKTLKTTVRQLFKKAQFVSQLKKNQICWNRTGKPKKLEHYFANQPPNKITIKLRGGAEKIVFFVSARPACRNYGESYLKNKFESGTIE